MASKKRSRRHLGRPPTACALILTRISRNVLQCHGPRWYKNFAGMLRRESGPP